VNRKRLPTLFAHAHLGFNESKRDPETHLHLPPLPPQIFAAKTKQVPTVKSDFVPNPARLSRKQAFAPE